MLLILAVGFRSDGQKREGGYGSPAGEISGDCVQLVDGVDALVGGDSEDDVDGVLRGTMGSKV
jgi:hypothetical protein